MPSEQEQLRERLKWLREVKRLQENSRRVYINQYLSTYRQKILPVEYQEMEELDEETLNEIIERTERDLRDLQKGEFQIE